MPLIHIYMDIILFSLSKPHIRRYSPVQRAYHTQLSRQSLSLSLYIPCSKPLCRQNIWITMPAPLCYYCTIHRGYVRMRGRCTIDIHIIILHYLRLFHFCAMRFLGGRVLSKYVYGKHTHSTRRNTAALQICFV